MVHGAMEAKSLLLQEGINARIINIHTIKPIDIDIIVKAAKETGAIVTAEEHSIIGGLGSAVAEVLAEHYPVPALRIGVQDKFGKSGKPDKLLEMYGLTAADIVKKTKEVLKMKKCLV
jgi:transketolase